MSSMVLEPGWYRVKDLDGYFHSIYILKEKNSGENKGSIVHPLDWF
jgi:hypothetical protein